VDRPILNKGADEQFAKDAKYLAGVVDDVIRERRSPATPRPTTCWA